MGYSKWVYDKDKVEDAYAELQIAARKLLALDKDNEVPRLIKQIKYASPNMGKYFDNPSAYEKNLNAISGAIDKLAEVTENLRKALGKRITEFEDYNNNSDGLLWLKKLWGTVTMTKIKLFQGVLKGFEGVMDTAATVLYWGSKLGQTKLMKNKLFQTGLFLIGGPAVLPIILPAYFPKNAPKNIEKFIKKDIVGDFFADEFSDGILNSVETYSIYSSESTAANFLEGVGCASAEIALIVGTGGAATPFVAAANGGMAVEGGLQKGQSMARATAGGVAVAGATFAFGGLTSMIGTGGILPIAAGGIGAGGIIGLTQVAAHSNNTDKLHSNRILETDINIKGEKTITGEVLPPEDPPVFPPPGPEPYDPDPKPHNPENNDPENNDPTPNETERVIENKPTGNTGPGPEAKPIEDKVLETQKIELTINKKVTSSQQQAGNTQASNAESVVDYVPSTSNQQSEGVSSQPATNGTGSGINVETDTTPIDPQTSTTETPTEAVEETGDLTSSVKDTIGNRPEEVIKIPTTSEQTTTKKANYTIPVVAGLAAAGAAGLGAKTYMDNHRPSEEEDEEYEGSENDGLRAEEWNGSYDDMDTDYGTIEEATLEEDDSKYRSYQANSILENYENIDDNVTTDNASYQAVSSKQSELEDYGE